MNPWNLDSADLMVWGLVIHLVADWLLQDDWMANNKIDPFHPAAWVHSGIHALGLAIIFGWVAAPLALLHLWIDTRKPVIWWSRLIRQTQPQPPTWIRPHYDENGPPVMDVGMEVRFWTDQVFHILCIAVAALLVG